MAMSGSKKHFPIPSITTAPTEDTNGSTDNEGRTPTFTPTPTDAHDDCFSFKTPKNETITISYRKLGLSPTILLPICEAIAKMNDDGILSEFVDRKEDGVYGLVVFLYGTGFFSNLKSDVRLQTIQGYIAKKGGNRKRLRELAFSDLSDRILDSKSGFDVYSNLVYTANRLFRADGAKGGFPVEVYYRVQTSKNCYIVAVAMWLTIKLQRDYPEMTQDPIDVGYIGRRYVIETREGLEKRVLHDKGGSAMALLCKITQRAGYFEKIICNYSEYPVGEEKSKQQQHDRLDECLGDKHVGLVSGFRTCENFRARSRCKAVFEKAGYWLFEGESIDDEGIFVPIEDNEVQKDELKGMWDNQLLQIRKKKMEHKNTLENISKYSHTKKSKNSKEDEKEISATEDIENPNESCTQPVDGTHAMVMLGFHTNNEGKRLYVLWNWWANMPLVLVSWEYLIACQCSVHFLRVKLPPSLFVLTKRNAAVACECSFPDNGEDTTFNFWDEYDY